MIRVALALVCLTLAVAPATADPAKAEQLANEAATSFTAGDFGKAAELFTKSYREDPSQSDVFCNIGISYFKLGELPRAHLLMSQCIDRSALKLEFKDNARAVLASIEEQLRAKGHAPITIRPVPKEATVVVVAFGPESEFIGARTIWLPFGKHQVEVRAASYITETLEVVAETQEPKTVELAIKPKPADPIQGVKPARKRAPKAAKWPAIATSVLAVAALVPTVIFYGKAHDAADAGAFAVDEEAVESSPFPDEVSQHNQKLTIFGAVTIVAAGVSGYLWYRALKTPPYLEVTPTAGGAAAAFTRRF